MVYTNWGITGGQFEPLDEEGLDCAKMCVGSNCQDHKWRTANCSQPMSYVCQIDCNFIIRAQLTKLMSN